MLGLPSIFVLDFLLQDIYSIVEPAAFPLTCLDRLPYLPFEVGVGKLPAEAAQSILEGSPPPDLDHKLDEPVQLDLIYGVEVSLRRTLPTFGYVVLFLIWMQIPDVLFEAVYQEQLHLQTGMILLPVNDDKRLPSHLVSLAQ